MFLKCLKKSIKLVSSSYRRISNIGEGGAVILCRSNFCFLFLRRLGRIFVEIILWSEDTPSKLEYASQFRALFIYFLFMNI